MADGEEDENAAVKEKLNAADAAVAVVDNKLYIYIFSISILMNINCQGRDMVVDDSRCHEQWPKFPCYSRAQKACYNEEGTEQLFSPLSDIGYGAGVTYLVLDDVISSIIGREQMTPQKKERDDMVVSKLVNYSYAYSQGESIIACLR